MKPPAERTIPARTIPVPSTVSPELQKEIAPAWSGSKSPLTLTNDEWKAMQKQADDERTKTLQPVKQKFHVSVLEEKTADVRVYRMKPQSIATENRNRLLVHLHGGGYVFGSGESAAAEAVLMASFGKIEVISVDYRMPPDFPFPAALDDALAVWGEIAGSLDTRNLGLFGSSAGGGLALAMLLELKRLKMSLPGAIMVGTPWSDMTKTGDTYYTNDLVDNVLGSYDGLLEAAANLYAGKHDLKGPLLSPVYGDFTDFPPVILISGTRDVFLSNTVRIHQKLLQAGGEAELLVFEGQSHAQYALAPDAPETAAAWKQVSKFFDRHLSK